MLLQIITENGVKKIKPLTADAGAGLPVGFIAPAYKKGNYSGWLYLDGRDTTGTSEELSTHYPLLYAYLGSNVLPDYREVAPTGAEENTTDTIATHDVFTEGQFKDDQLQDHAHFICSESGDTGPYGGKSFICRSINSNTYGEVDTGLVMSAYRKGTVTRGKRKAVYFYIKATSGLSENAQDNVVAQLNEERSYSTEEVNTGKKWIDGKPIYRKTFEYNDLLCNTSAVRLQENFPIAYSNIVNMKLVAYRSRTAGMAMIINTIYVTNGSVYFVNNISEDYFNIKLTVEYTKTTD